MSSKRCIQVGVVLLAGSLLLFWGYFLRKPGDKITTVITSEETPVFRAAERSSPARIPDATSILSGNVFHPSRGKVNTDMKTKKQNAPAVQQRAGQFELTGIFQYQNTRGALIAVQQLSADPKKPKPRRMYKLGDSLGNGYNLVEISDAHVVIARGNERINLPLRKTQDRKR